MSNQAVLSASFQMRTIESVEAKNKTNTDHTRTKNIVEMTHDTTTSSDPVIEKMKLIFAELERQHPNWIDDLQKNNTHR